MYSIRSFIDTLAAGGFVLETGGHRLYRSAEETLKLAHEDSCDLLQWAERDALEDGAKGEVNKRMLESMQRGEFIRVGEYLPAFTVPDDNTCSCCGESPKIFLKSPGILALSCVQRERVPDARWPRRLPPVAEPCMFAGGCAPHKTVIEVISGELLFANFFRDIANTPAGEEYSSEYDLNSCRGRFNRADYLAGRNVGYAQTGNMSVHIYQRTAGDELVLLRSSAEWLNDDIYELECQLEDEPDDAGLIEELGSLRRVQADLVANYRYCGEISCEMWRWMCADTEILSASGYSREKGMDYVQVAVRPGRWEITNYYDSDEYQPPRMAQLQFLE